MGRIIAILFSILFTGSAVAQSPIWEPVATPPGARFGTLFEHSSGVLVGFVSADPMATPYGGSSGIEHTLFRSEPPYDHWTATRIWAWIDDIVETTNGRMFVNVWHNPETDNIFMSSDTGRTWQHVFAIQNCRLAAQGNNVVVLGKTDSLALSTDGGLTWSKSESGLEAAANSSPIFLDSQNRLYCVIRSKGIYRTADWQQAPVQWSLIYNTNRFVETFMEFPNGSLCVPLFDGLYVSIDDGNQWDLAAPFPSRERYHYHINSATMAANGDIYMTNQTPHQSGYNSNTYTLMRLPYGSSVWDSVRSIGAGSNYGRCWAAKSLYVNVSGVVHKSDDNGRSWTDATGDLGLYPYFDLLRLGNGELLLNGRLGMFYSSEQQTKWSHHDLFMEKICLGSNGEVYAYHRDTLIVSDDNGRTFSEIPVSPAFPYFVDIACLPDGDLYLSGIFMTTGYPGSVVVTSNRGATWSTLTENPPGYLFSSPKGSLYFIDRQFRRYNPATSELDSIVLDIEGSHSYPPSFVPSAVMNSGAFVGALWGGDLLRVDSGFTAAETIPYISADSGTYRRVRCFGVDPSDVLYAGDQYGVYRTTDMGDTWAQYDSGIVTKYIYDLYYDDTDGRMYCTTPDGIYRTIDPVVVGTDYTPTPQAVSLAQNYPNPFSGNTTVRYTVPTEQVIMLTVYNMLGQPVWRSERQAHQGSNTASITGLPPGLYRLVLRSNNGVAVRTMVAR